ncbi:phosphoribosylamine--glycine ligase [Tuberibacillus sp. Marseille-P3662]|uniref:phosphoribosylamine--glycine ligase n=1 Tax=Tuberibacillus sp. Marseille-P3662 TaxID=1965358 RepID=UPI000A1CEDF7|nr:phosphoribosylamine--glycine ligase [Tuberibacillus sp. Marseille-P3662]
MNVLVIGKGGREHALAWKLVQSDQVGTIYAAPGSAAIAEVAVTVDIAETDGEALVAFAKDKAIDLTIVGPEQPLVDGMVDRFEAEGLKIFGPNRQAAEIEGSKAFAKYLMATYDIPTADHQSFTDYDEAVAYVEEKGAPIVIKADGLASGKGVTVAASVAEAVDALTEIMKDARFGAAGDQVVVEEFLAGEEFSLMAFVNGENVYPLVLSQDHKRAFLGDKGPNTGGMGAYSPVPQLPDDALLTAMVNIMEPTARAMIAEGRPYCGLLYAGLIWTSTGPKVIEFNCRFGDPETQVVLPRLKSDLLQVMNDVLNGQSPDLEWDERACCGIVLASEGYPGSYEKGTPLPNLHEVDTQTLMFHAGTKQVDGGWQSDGGRILLVASLASHLEAAIDQANQVIERVQSDGTFYREDIGYRALNKAKYA